MTDLTEIFGLHDNAEITSAIGSTNKMLETALSLQSAAGGAAAGGKTEDEQIQDIAEEILKKLPKNFDIESAAKQHPIKYEDSMNTVL